MNETTPVKLRHISIKDYKGIEHLELDFPAPELPGDPDVVVIGSENGLGKTSVLECCALGLFGLRKTKTFKEKAYTNVEFPNLLVRAGSTKSEIECLFSNGIAISTVIGNNEINNKIASPCGGGTSYSYNDIALEQNEEAKEQDMIPQICGFSPNPVTGQHIMFFHGYRKTSEGNPRFSSLLGGKPPLSNGTDVDTLTGVFKSTALFAMMSNADLFDGPKDTGAGTTLKTLNRLLEQYADCRFTKLRPTQNDSMELRVQSVGGGESFNFDGLSSGQKEIVTTLFLIWYETRNQPKVVLIDEPELHLNSQWHRSFINSLIELAPLNQYIIATHSPTIMDSVDRNRRILLQRDKEAVR